MTQSAASEKEARKAFKALDLNPAQKQQFRLALKRHYFLLGELQACIVARRFYAPLRAS